MTFSMLLLQAPSGYYGAVFSFFIVVILAFLSTKWIAKIRLNTMEGKNIQVVERVYLSTDKQLLIVKVGNQFFLMSQDKSGIKMLNELTDFTPSEIEEPQKFAYFLEKFKNNKGN